MLCRYAIETGIGVKEEGTAEARERRDCAAGSARDSAEGEVRWEGLICLGTKPGSLSEQSRAVGVSERAVVEVGVSEQSRAVEVGVFEQS